MLLGSGPDRGRCPVEHVCTYARPPSPGAGVDLSEAGFVYLEAGPERQTDRRTDRRMVGRTEFAPVFYRILIPVGSV